MQETADAWLCQCNSGWSSNSPRVRVLLGDPDNPEVAERGHDEEIGEAMASKVRNALALYKALRAIDGAEVRLHRTVLSGTSPSR